ncbi:hypothetical protein F3Y22_tig00110325pilonHSYRG00082 [Hibiscus syriacus]|uniref:ATPase AAA-type core domain-containing protein n=1 Tax=Hibiscus syriacus TaxID=106335 RepID=A0A6A3B4P0_HIBSY|nr:hypothetical protein F3Y22_tig00110325pilonHSYRG00082 [Hibiscus syriacus]
MKESNLMGDDMCETKENDHQGKPGRNRGNEIEAIKEENKVVKLFSLKNFICDGQGVWGSTNIDHPATFDKLAMDLAVKKELINDLDRFVRRRDFYRRVGKAWKRGYLLFGPPGTGNIELQNRQVKRFELGECDAFEQDTNEKGCLISSTGYGRAAEMRG